MASPFAGLFTGGSGGSPAPSPAPQSAKPFAGLFTAPTPAPAAVKATPIAPITPVAPTSQPAAPIAPINAGSTPSGASAPIAIPKTGPIPAAPIGKPESITEKAGADMEKYAPALTQTLADLQTNPANLGNSLKSIVETPYTDLMTASDNFNAAAVNFATGLKNKVPASQDVSNGLQAATSLVGGALTPITTWFNVANKLPVVGDVSKLLFNVPFSALGDVSGDTGVGALTMLRQSNGGPIPDQAADNLEPGIRAVSTLAGQIIAGKYIAPDVMDMLNKHFGPEDAQTIVSKAQEVANEAKDNPNSPATKTVSEPTEPDSVPQPPAPETKAPVEPQAPQSSPSSLPSWAPDEAKALATETAKPTDNPAPLADSITSRPGETPALPSKSMPAGALRPIEGIGETKTRGLSEGVLDKAIANTPSRLPGFAPDEAKILEQKQVATKLADTFGDLPQYKQMDVADQGARAIDLFQKDPEAARQIAYGAKAPPKGLTPEAVFIAVEQDAIERGDGQTLRELANSRLTSEATTMGQRLRMLAERNPESPTDAVRSVQEAREKAVEAQNGGKNINVVKDKVADDITKNIAKETAKPRDWASFVSAIQC